MTQIILWLMLLNWFALKIRQITLWLYPSFHSTQVVRISDGHYRHPECYTCTDCNLNLKMRGHFWVADTMYCEKHARERYGGPTSPSCHQWVCHFTPAPFWTQSAARPPEELPHLIQLQILGWDMNVDTAQQHREDVFLITFNYILQYRDLFSCVSCNCMTIGALFIRPSFLRLLRLFLALIMRSCHWLISNSHYLY